MDDEHAFFGLVADAQLNEKDDELNSGNGEEGAEEEGAEEEGGDEEAGDAQAEAGNNGQ